MQNRDSGRGALCLTVLGFGEKALKRRSPANGSAGLRRKGTKTPKPTIGISRPSIKTLKPSKIGLGFVDPKLGFVLRAMFPRSLTKSKMCDEVRLRRFCSEITRTGFEIPTPNIES